MRRKIKLVLNSVLFVGLMFTSNNMGAQINNKNKIKMKTTESKFMSDHSEGDHGLEAILDYELSWVLRMAADKECQAKKPLLYHQCRHILFKMLDMEDSPNIIVDTVEVWKQWSYIDLVADVYLIVNGRKELHVILAEDKAYTLMKENQRDIYPKTVMEAYDNYPRYKNYRDYKLHKVLVTCFSVVDQLYKYQQEFIEGSGWRILSIEELPDWDAEEQTESDLFNDFWLNDWIRKK